MFGKRQPEPPVRQDQVARLIKATDDEDTAAARDIDSPQFGRARAVRDAVARASTPAEIDAAYDAWRRGAR
ncbi:hypothetical protein OOK41_31530 [Micromonospora sp. NBC_01655]|uniref:hypothetical protein n=1 Tax=Micromonospora sp. NBC_01655 TaxID=2975983 RepID=UPI0022519396|nr:hypothetical protein [Micromonospora sp. NBC_01655]MCX4474793.1 hypothetical protein [Micromonospora sp. NBC_01655]